MISPHSCTCSTTSPAPGGRLNAYPLALHAIRSRTTPQWPLTIESPGFQALLRRVREASREAQAPLPGPAVNSLEDRAQLPALWRPGTAQRSGSANSKQLQATAGCPGSAMGMQCGVPYSWWTLRWWPHSAHLSSGLFRLVHPAIICPLTCVTQKAHQGRPVPRSTTLALPDDDRSALRPRPPAYGEFEYPHAFTSFRRALARAGVRRSPPVSVHRRPPRQGRATRAPARKPKSYQLPPRAMSYTGYSAQPPKMCTMSTIHAVVRPFHRVRSSAAAQEVRSSRISPLVVRIETTVHLRGVPSTNAIRTRLGCPSAVVRTRSR